MASEAGELRRRVMTLGRRTRGARIPDELRAEVIRYAMVRRRHGDGLREIAQALGVSPECVFRPKPITDSGASRSVIPEEADHRFRSMPINDRLADRRGPIASAR